MPREVARVGATAIIWSAMALIYAFLLIGKSIGPFEMVLGILVAISGLVGTGAVWEQLSDSKVQVNVSGAEGRADTPQKQKGDTQSDALRRLAETLDDDSAATLMAALQERDGSDGEFLSLQSLVEEERQQT